MQPLISVIVTSYNHAAYIRQCLLSIVDQPYPRIELVVADDGSSDDSCLIIESLQADIEARIERFKFLKLPHRGLNPTVNAALAAATGEYLAFCASDDFFLEDRFTSQLEYFNAHPDCAVVYSNGLMWNGSQYLGQTHSPETGERLRKPSPDVLDFLVTNISPFYIQSMLIKTALMDRIGGFDDRILTDDWVLNIRIFKTLVELGMEHGYVDRNVFAYRLHPAQSHRNFGDQFRRCVEPICYYTPPEKRADFLQRVFWQFGMSMGGKRISPFSQFIALEETQKAIHPANTIRLDRNQVAQPFVYIHNPRLEVLSEIRDEPRIVIDIGCNTGASCEWVKKQYPGCTTVGVEINPHAAKIAKGHVDILIELPIEEIVWREYGIEPGTVDFIIIADVLEHLENPWQVLHDLRHLLSPSGAVLASIPNARNLWLLDHLANGNWTYTNEGLLDATHLRFFTRKEIERLFRKAGYEISCIRQNVDGRVRQLLTPEGSGALIETEKLIVKNVTAEERGDLATLQFLVTATPSDEAAYQPQARRVRLGVLSVDSPNQACDTLRVSDPLALLADYVDVVRLVRRNDTSIGEAHIREEFIDDCDIFLVQRFFPKAETASTLEKVFSTGKPVLYETDDLLDQIPPENPMYERIKPNAPYIIDVIGKATGLIVSTDEIKSHYTPLNPNIKVFRNRLCAERWHGIENQTDKQGPVTIGFAGTSTHQHDIKLIESAIFKAARVLEDRVRFVFWGAITDELRNLPNCTWLNTAVTFSEYPRRLASLGFDIGLAPLNDSAFNRCKSNLKWLEYSMLGIPVICSDVKAFADAKHNHLALVVPNEERAWFEAIVRLVEDAELRRNLGKNAQEHVRQNYMLDQHVWEYASWLNVFLPEGLQLPPPSRLQLQPLPVALADDLHIAPEEYQSWRIRHQLQEVDAEVLAERMMRWPNRPTFAVLMLVRGDELVRLADTIDALQRQLYPQWKLVVISDRPSPDAVFEQTDVLGWLQIADASDEAQVAQALTEVLPVLEVDYFCMAPAGTRFESHAFVLVGDYFQRHPEWALLYTDHDFIDRDGEHRRPAFKPDFNLDLLRSSDYPGNAVFFRSQAVIAAGGIHPYPQAEVYDLVLRLHDQFGEGAIGHLAEPLLGFPNVQPDLQFAEASRRVAVESHLARAGIAADVSAGYLSGTLRVKYRHEGSPPVSVIIPNRDKIEVLEPCLTSLFTKTGYPNFEVVVVDNQSEDPDVFALYAEMGKAHGERFRVVNYDAPFNFAAQINLGAQLCRGELILLLNNDCEIIQEEWLDRMLHHARRPEVGAVGAMLIAPETSQVRQAGILLGPPGGLLSIADHAFAGKYFDEPGYMSRLQVDQNYSAVTAACLLVRKEVFDQVGGFDADNFAVLMNDVDFCLRVGKAGYKNVWTPYARVLHHEGRSLKGVTSDPEKILRSLLRERQEFRAMLDRWLPVLAKDPAGNRHLSLKNACMHLETRLPLGWDPEMHDRNRILGFPLVGGSGEYRVAMPLRGLAQAGLMHTELVQPIGGKVPEISVVEMARQAPDTLLLHATLNTMTQEILPVWREYFPAMRLVFGLDDRMDKVPEKSSAYLGQQRHFADIRLRMRKVLKCCNAAVVSTEPLADMVRDMIDDVQVIPNALERQVWEKLRSRRRTGRKPRVGWVGAQQHRGDLELIYEVVKATANDVEWVFMGMWLPEFSEFVHERHQFVAFKDYPGKMASLNLDLAIAPLEINEFNEAKSNLRLLEYGVLGFPVLCTDIFPYRTKEAPVTCLPNDPKRWIEAIQDKVRDADQLAHEGDTLRAWVLENFMLDQHLEAWYEVLSPHA